MKEFILNNLNYFSKKYQINLTSEKNQSFFAKSENFLIQNHFEATATENKFFFKEALRRIFLFQNDLYKVIAKEIYYDGLNKRRKQDKYIYKLNFNYTKIFSFLKIKDNNIDVVYDLILKTNNSKSFGNDKFSKRQLEKVLFNLNYDLFITFDSNIINDIKLRLNINSLELRNT